MNPTNRENLGYINLQIWSDRDWGTEFQIARDVFIITYSRGESRAIGPHILQIEYRLLCAKCERSFLLRPYGIAPGRLHSQRQSERERRIKPWTIVTQQIGQIFHRFDRRANARRACSSVVRCGFAPFIPSCAFIVRWITLVSLQVRDDDSPICIPHRLNSRWSLPIFPTIDNRLSFHSFYRGEPVRKTIRCEREKKIGIASRDCIRCVVDHRRELVS